MRDSGADILGKGGGGSMSQCAGAVREDDNPGAVPVLCAVDTPQPPRAAGDAGEGLCAVCIEALRDKRSGSFGAAHRPDGRLPPRRGVYCGHGEAGLHNGKRGRAAPRLLQQLRSRVHHRRCGQRCVRLSKNRAAALRGTYFLGAHGRAVFQKPQLLRRDAAGVIGEH